MTVFEEALTTTRKFLGDEHTHTVFLLNAYEKAKLLLQEQQSTSRNERVPQRASSPHSVTTHGGLLLWQLTALAALLALAVGSRRA